jgi:hypothetical protein
MNDLWRVILTPMIVDLYGARGILTGIVIFTITLGDARIEIYASHCQYDRGIHFM